MKSFVNSKKAINLAVGVCGLIAGVLLALGIMTYRQDAQITARDQASVRLAEKLMETEQLNALIRELNRGETAMAKRSLNLRLAYNLTLIDGLAMTTGDSDKAFAKFVLTQLKHAQQAHPDYYLAAAGSTPFDSTEQLVRH